jgi:hypothetical protein
MTRLKLLLVPVVRSILPTWSAHLDDKTVILLLHFNLPIYCFSHTPFSIYLTFPQSMRRLISTFFTPLQYVLLA